MRSRILRHVLLALGIAHIATGCQENKNCISRTVPQRAYSWSSRIEKFSACEDIKKYQADFYSSENPSCGGPIRYDSSVNYNPPNQVAGIREGDLLQSNTKYFFFARPGSIEIVEKASLRKQLSLPVPLSEKRWILLIGKNLIFVGSDRVATQISIFDQENSFKQAFKKTIDADIVDFRVSDSKLVLVTKKWPVNPDNLPTPCNNIYRPHSENGSSELTLVTTIEFTANPIKEQNLGLMGGADSIYLTQNELILFHNGSTSIEWSSPSHFQVVNWSDANLAVRQVQVYNGYIKDRWSIRQTENHLFIAVTDFGSNKLIAFERNSEGAYTWLSESPVFGHNEDIRSVLFLEDKAFVVTFEKTDPLFILDLSRPEKIEILSELESPGFSTQLISLSNNFMGGLGYDTLSETDFSWFGGLKFSLFDVAAPLSPKEVSVLKFGDRGSSSEATSEPKALYRFQDQRKVAFPAVLREKDGKQFPNEFARNLKFAGTIILGVSKGRLHEQGRLTHQLWREEECGPQSSLRFGWWNTFNASSDIQRTIEFRNDLYTFSRFGVMKHDRNSLREIEAVRYSASKTVCDTP